MALFFFVAAEFKAVHFEIESSGVLGKMPKKMKVNINKRSTLFKSHEKMSRKPVPECHGGEGVLDLTLVLGAEETRSKRLNFTHDETFHREHLLASTNTWMMKDMELGGIPIES